MGFLGGRGDELLYLILSQWMPCTDHLAALAPGAIVGRTTIVRKVKVLGPHPGHLFGPLLHNGRARLVEFICKQGIYE